VGPITLIDEVGLDIAGKSGAIMAEAFGARMQPERSAAAVLGAGRLGRKGKQGFYAYDEKGKREGVDDSVYQLYPAAPEARGGAARGDPAAALARDGERGGAVPRGRHRRSARDGDIGAVFGIGFPPFRGGPFRHIDAVGAAEVVRQLEALDAQHPGRFAPARILKDMAAAGTRFYPREGKPV
jgi:3-hydroxyacyl-CoA dehydrogenase / enoyl-CoA hydratase / 3-hydroxybutyryl-CoA epimerase